MQIETERGTVNTHQPDDRQQLRCACGSTTFTVGQFTYNTQEFDSQTEDWSASDYCYESDYVVCVECDECGADCTDLAALDATDFPRVFHEAFPERRPIPCGERRDVLVPPMRIEGRYGAAKDARWALRASSLGGDHALELWRGNGLEKWPLLTIPGSLDALLAHVKAVYELLLDTQAQAVAEKRAREATAANLAAATELLGE